MSKDQKTISQEPKKSPSIFRIIAGTLEIWISIFVLFFLSIWLNQYLLYQFNWDIIQNYIPQFLKDGILVIPTFGIQGVKNLTVSWSVHNYPFFFILAGYVSVWMSRWPLTQYSVLFDYNNNDPRSQQKGFKPNSLGSRLVAAHYNAIENFAPFALGVIVAVISGVPTILINKSCAIYLVSRFIFQILYMVNLAALRSTAWFVGFTISLNLMFLSSMKGSIVLNS